MAPILLAVACGPAQEDPTGRREAAIIYPGASWTAASPAEMGMDAARLAEARDFALTGGGSGMITRGGKLVMSWGSRTATYDLKSTTKSIGVTALGLAIDDGKIALSSRAATLHPSFGVPPDANRATGWLDDITVQHLANQTAGFDKVGGYTDLQFSPGTKWHYSDGGPNWLAECVTLAYRRDLRDLMFERVFTPIGIPAAQLVWRTNSYRPATLDGIANREFGSGISASVDAMARIGYLYLREGIWEGASLLSGSFVMAVRTTIPKGLPEHIPDYGNASDHYSLLWWNNADGSMAGVPRDTYQSRGLFDSWIIVIPSLDVVATRAGPTIPGSNRATRFIASIAASVRAGIDAAASDAPAGDAPSGDAPSGDAPAGTGADGGGGADHHPDSASPDGGHVPPGGRADAGADAPAAAETGAGGGGCGCRTAIAPGPGGPSGSLALVALAIAVRRRRRRGVDSARRTTSFTTHSGTRVPKSEMPMRIREASRAAVQAILTLAALAPVGCLGSIADNGSSNGKAVDSGASDLARGDSAPDPTAVDAPPSIDPRTDGGTEGGATDGSIEGGIAPPPPPPGLPPGFPTQPSFAAATPQTIPNGDALQDEINRVPENGVRDLILVNGVNYGTRTIDCPRSSRIRIRAADPALEGIDTTQRVWSPLTSATDTHISSAVIQGSNPNAPMVNFRIATAGDLWIEGIRTSRNARAIDSNVTLSGLGAKSLWCKNCVFADSDNTIILGGHNRSGWDVAVFWNCWLYGNGSIAASGGVRTDYGWRIYTSGTTWIYKCLVEGGYNHMIGIKRNSGALHVYNSIFAGWQNVGGSQHILQSGLEGSDHSGNDTTGLVTARFNTFMSIPNHSAGQHHIALYDCEGGIIEDNWFSGSSAYGIATLINTQVYSVTGQRAGSKGLRIARNRFLVGSIRPAFRNLGNGRPYTVTFDGNITPATIPIGEIQSQVKVAHIPSEGMGNSGFRNP